MKTIRTKAQEVTAQLFGVGRYMVTEDDIPQLKEHLERVLLEVLADEYADVIVKYISGGKLSSVEKQRKFHGMRNAPVALQLLCDPQPHFLTQVDYSLDREWTLRDLAEAVFGSHGDTKIYSMDLPSPTNGKSYTTDEVLAILEGLDGN